MRVELLHHTPLWVCARAIRTCWDSHDKSDTTFISKAGELVGVCGEKDKELIERVGNKNKHSSTLEHLCYSYEIDGISRACLQELARHRMASLSVKSSRYTLKEIKNEKEPFLLDNHSINQDILSRYIVLTGICPVDMCSAYSLENLRDLLQSGISNDISKYSLPESFKTRLVWTINARSLQNFLSLRTSKSALKEIRDLAYNIFEVLPEDHKYLFEDFVNKENK